MALLSPKCVGLQKHWAGVQDASLSVLALGSRRLTLRDPPLTGWPQITPQGLYGHLGQPMFPSPPLLLRVKLGFGPSMSPIASSLQASSRETRHFCEWHVSHLRMGSGLRAALKPWQTPKQREKTPPEVVPRCVPNLKSTHKPAPWFRLTLL